MAKDFKSVTKELQTAAQAQLETFLATTKANAVEAKQQLEAYMQEIAPSIEAIGTFVALGEFEQAMRTLEFYKDAIVVHTARVMLSLADNERVAFNQFLTGLLRGMISFAASLMVV